MKILVCDPDQHYAKSVATLSRSIGEHEVLYAAGPGQLDPVVEGEDTTTVVFGPGVAPAKAMEWTSAHRARGGSFSAIIVVQTVTTELLRLALKAGVDDVLEASSSAEEVTGALADAVRRAEGRRSTEAAAQEHAHRQRGTIVTVFGTKGGVGKTVIAVNLGVALAKMGRSVALVDLDLQFGDTAIMLGLEPRRTILGAVQEGDRLDDDMLRGYLTDHASGLKVLLAPVRPEEAESITASRVSKVLEMMAGMFDVVVIDTPAALDDVVLAALDVSDKVIAVTMMDVASVKNMRVSLQKLKQLGYDESRLELLLNRADSRVFLQPDEVERAVGSKIRFSMPSDQIVPRSVNKGTPMVIEAPKSPIAGVIAEIARSVGVREREYAHVT